MQIEIVQYKLLYFECKHIARISSKMLLFEELPGFLTVMLNLHMRFDSVYVQKEPVNFTSMNPIGDCPGSLNGGMRAPSKCLIVVQEWWGMNEQIKEQARQIGELGKFVTLVPDLYRGEVAENTTEAIHLVSKLNYPGELIKYTASTRKTTLLLHPLNFLYRCKMILLDVSWSSSMLHLFAPCTSLSCTAFTAKIFGY